MGLEKTQAIGRIVVHPTNPNIVYVAALGAPWNANPERGLYKTEDGGQRGTSSNSFPTKLVSSTSRSIRRTRMLSGRRAGSEFEAVLPQLRRARSALWKSTDAGKTWTEIKGGGFPETTKGRIGIAISLSNPRVMYTMVEADTLPNPKG